MVSDAVNKAIKEYQNRKSNEMPNGTVYQYDNVRINVNRSEVNANRDRIDVKKPYNDGYRIEFEELV